MGCGPHNVQKNNNRKKKEKTHSKIQRQRIYFRDSEGYPYKVRMDKMTPHYSNKPWLDEILLQDSLLS